jgi:3-isopropylmalate/(R)-2-methylmalate dehydratase large subunit
MSPMTIAEKIFARTSGKPTVTPGEVEWVVPDRVLMYDFPGDVDRWADRLKDEAGVKNLPLGDRGVMFIDHFVPSRSPAITAAHNKSKQWARGNGMLVSEGRGIGHQVSAEMGLALPGDLVVHMDTHVQILGAFGALPFSLAHDVFTALSVGKIWLEVPETIQVELIGDLQPGVDGRDLMHRLIADHGSSWGAGSILEFVGPGAERMTVDQRMNAMVMVCFTGAFSGVFPADDIARSYLAERGKTDLRDIRSDPGARIKEQVTYDLSTVEPMIVLPGAPSNAVPISQTLGHALQQGFIGSCSSGRIEDLRAAATILRGQRVAENFRLFVVPTSSEIMAQASAEGLIEVFIEAGAFLGTGSCDFCFGVTQVPADGDQVISTGTLSVRGRLGNTKADIYLGSASTVAASAIRGAITDPRDIG